MEIGGGGGGGRLTWAGLLKGWSCARGWTLAFHFSLFTVEDKHSDEEPVFDLVMWSFRGLKCNECLLKVCWDWTEGHTSY